MCGIVGYIGKDQAVGILMEGLKRLEYRGYDSAGVAVLRGGEHRRRQGHAARSTACAGSWRARRFPAACGIGHTRWATHGEPSDENSHPHLSQPARSPSSTTASSKTTQRLARKAHRQGLSRSRARRTPRSSPTCWRILLKTERDLLGAVRRHRCASSRAPMPSASSARDDPDAHRRRPQGQPAHRRPRRRAATTSPPTSRPCSPYTQATSTCSRRARSPRSRADQRRRSTTCEGEPVHKEVLDRRPGTSTAAEKGGYAHFMLKEIYEQPPRHRATRSAPACKDGRHRPRAEAELTDELLRGVRNASSSSPAARPTTPAWSAQCVIEKLCRGSPSRSTSPPSSATATPSSSRRTCSSSIIPVGRDGGHPRRPAPGASRAACKALAIVNVVGSHHRPGGGQRALHLGRPGDRRGLHQGLHRPACWCSPVRPATGARARARLTPARYARATCRSCSACRSKAEELLVRRQPSASGCAARYFIARGHCSSSAAAWTIALCHGGLAQAQGDLLHPLARPMPPASSSTAPSP